MSTVPVPEIRRLVEVAKQYLAGDAHFTALVKPAEDCAIWAKVQNAPPQIRSLAESWLRLIDRVWNEYRQHPEPLPEAELRRQVADDLGQLS